MEKKPISPELHCIIDYLLVGSLLTVPTLLNFNKKAKIIYAAEALTLLGYVVVTDSPVGLKPLIPFPIHGKIDPFNVGQFALQSLLKPFRKDKKALLFNITFTAIACATVLLTNWTGPTKKHV